MQKWSISLALCGGLCSAELRSLFTLTTSGSRASGSHIASQSKRELLPRAFQQEPVPSLLCIEGPCKLEGSIPDLTAASDLFHRPLKSDGISKQVMGQHALSGIESGVATELGSDSPETYSGHCFRCPPATEAEIRLTGNTTLAGYKRELLQSM